jgi:protein O-mannosyl-transferase
VLLGRYLVLLTAPLKLSLDYGSHVIGWTVDWRQPYVYLGAAALAAWLIATAWALRRRHRAVLFCLLALAISYGMVSNSLVLIGTIFGERLMYLPSAFFLILAAALLARLLRPALLGATLLVLATLGSIRTFTYARLWNDPLKLYLADLDAYPQSMHLHGMAVYQYLARGDRPAALAAQETAEDCVKQVPYSWHSYEMCVAVDEQLHDFKHAEEILAGARPLPGFPQPPEWRVYPRATGIHIAQLRAKVEAEREKEEGRER